MQSGFWRERTLDPDTLEPAADACSPESLTCNLNVRPWLNHRSTVGQEAGRAWTWPEVSRLALAGASLERMLPSCNSLAVAKFVFPFKLSTLKQSGWESGDRVLSLSRTARSLGEKQWPTSACRQPCWKQLRRTPRYFLLVNSMWLTRSIFFSLSKSRFLSVNSDGRKAWNSVNVSGNLESLFL